MRKGITMGDTGELPQREQRLLEGWLPLAQHLNEAHAWGASPAALEALVLIAAPALAQAQSVAVARATLLIYHTRHGRAAS